MRRHVVLIIRGSFDTLFVSLLQYYVFIVYLRCLCNVLLTRIVHRTYVFSLRVYSKLCSLSSFGTARSDFANYKYKLKCIIFKGFYSKLHDLTTFELSYPAFLTKIASMKTLNFKHCPH